MSRRPADCMVLCDEVISTILELLPGKLVLKELEEQVEAGTRDVNDKIVMLLWVGAAYLLQGHCYSHLKDWKQAVTHYTRSGRCSCFYFHCIVLTLCTNTYTWLFYSCINVAGVSTCWGKCALKRKVRTFFPFFMLCNDVFVFTQPSATLCILFCWCSVAGFQQQIPSADVVVKKGTDQYILQKLKGLSLAGRGISFTQTDQLKDALRDLQLSLQASPGICHKFLVTYLQQNLGLASTPDYCSNCYNGVIQRQVLSSKQYHIAQNFMIHLFTFILGNFKFMNKYIFTVSQHSEL